MLNSIIFTPRLPRLNWWSYHDSAKQEEALFKFLSATVYLLTEIGYWVHFNFCKYHHRSLAIIEAVIKQYNPNALLMRLWNSEEENILCYLECSVFWNFRSAHFKSNESHVSALLPSVLPNRFLSAECHEAWVITWKTSATRLLLLFAFSVVF